MQHLVLRVSFIEFLTSLAGCKALPDEMKDGWTKVLNAFS